MKTSLRIAILASAALALGVGNAFALPKAAEDIDAPVTAGADVARPRTAAKKPLGANVKVTKKGKAAKPAPRRKEARAAR